MRTKLMGLSVQLSDTLQTTCPHCGSIFRLSPDHLEIARGQVRCSECMQTFNALLSIKNYTGEYDDALPESNTDLKPNQEPEETIEHSGSEIEGKNDAFPESNPGHNTTQEPDKTIEQSGNEIEEETVSLNEAMYGDNFTNQNNYKPLLWITGILVLTILVIIQVVYYQRYSLISSADYQQQILSLCKILPCDESRFTSLSQVKLLERNIFTHPTRKNALMVSGSFVNQAPFSQSVPNLLISLSDTQGKFFANRLFKADEFLLDKTVRSLKPGRPVQFRLEIIDPGNEALAYEFEFYS